jgi:hypothetical protein
LQRKPPFNLFSTRVRRFYAIAFRNSYHLLSAYEPLSKQKAPKVLADAVTWINTALLEFGIAGLSLRSLIEFLKTALQNSNAAVRTSATKTLVTVKLFAGSSAFNAGVFHK